MEKNNEVIVEFGVITHKILRAFDAEHEVMFADFFWDKVLAEIPTQTFEVKPIPKFPMVKRDFALLVDESASFDSLKEMAMKTERSLLKEVTLFDVYKGKNLPEGKKSYALSFSLQDEKRTLTDKQIDKIMNKLQLQFEKEFGATLR